MSPSVTIASAWPWRFSALFMKASAADLSRFLETSARGSRLRDRRPARGKPSRHSGWLRRPSGHVHLIQVPSPMAKPAYPTDSLPPNVASEHWPKPVPPHPHGFMTLVDTALEQQVLDISQRQREAHIHPYHQPNFFGRRVETAERRGRFSSGFAVHSRPLPVPVTDCHIGLTAP